MQIQFNTSITMKKSLLFIGICLLFAVGCNRPDKAKQQKEEAATSETVQQDQGFDLFTLEAFVDLINQNDEAAAAKCGMTLLYEGELEEDMEEFEGLEGEEGDAGFYVTVFGKDIEKGEPSETGYEMKVTSDHAYYYELVSATSFNQNLYFDNPADANAFYEKLSQQEVVKGEKSFSVAKQTNQLGEDYLLLTSVDDDNLVFEISAPVCENGFCLISIYQYV